MNTAANTPSLLTFEEAVKMAAEIVVENTVEPGMYSVSSVSLPTLDRGVFYCDVFEGTLKVARTSVYEFYARATRTVGETSEHTSIKWL